MNHMSINHISYMSNCIKSRRIINSSQFYFNLQYLSTSYKFCYHI